MHRHDEAKGGFTSATGGNAEMPLFLLEAQAVDVLQL